MQYRDRNDSATPMLVKSWMLLLLSKPIPAAMKSRDTAMDLTRTPAPGSLLQRRDRLCLVLRRCGADLPSVAIAVYHQDPYQRDGWSFLRRKPVVLLAWHWLCLQVLVYQLLLQ